MKHGVWVG